VRFWIRGEFQSRLSFEAVKAKSLKAVFRVTFFIRFNYQSMSVRITALYIFVTFLCIYAWKDWLKSLCGLIVLMAVIDHPDMPRSIFGIQGLNPWNVLFLAIFVAWLWNRRREGLTWDIPRSVSMLLLIYLAVIVLGVLRAAFDRSHIEDYPLRSLISEELINTIKWILPAILLFDGCRTRKQVIMALVCLLVMYFLFAVQVVKWMPPEAALSESGMMNNVRRRCVEEIGYSAADLSVLLGGASWGFLAVLQLIPKKCYRVLVLAAAGVVAFGQALTGGRGGYVAWGITGLVMCLIRWRKHLILVPVVVMVLPVIFPGAAARMLLGFGQTDVAGQAAVDEVAVTSGRNLFWPPVIEKIGESPLVGYGRRAMERTGVKEWLLNNYGQSEAVAHPHNMYLETLLDNGILGSLPFWSLFVLGAIYSARLFRSNNRLHSAVGGLALALILTSLIGGLSGQHYFPQEHTMGIWAAMFLSLRVYVEEKREASCVNSAGLYMSVDRQGRWPHLSSEPATRIR